MIFEGEEDAQVVDGEVVGRARQASSEPAFRPAGPQGRIYEVDQQYTQQAGAYDANQYGGNGVDVTGIVDAGVSMAFDPRVKNLSLLIEVPLCAYIALNDKVPGLVRLGAVALGVMRALEAASKQDEYQQMLPQQEW